MAKLSPAKRARQDALTLVRFWHLIYGLPPTMRQISPYLTRVEVLELLCCQNVWEILRREPTLGKRNGKPQEVGR